MLDTVTKSPAIDFQNVRRIHGFPAWLQLVRAYNFMEAHMSADLRDDNLTLAQFDALVALVKKGAISQQELADHLLVTKGNVVGLIDRLSARRFVERRGSDTDRRVNLLQITSRGRRVVERALPRQLKLISRLMTALTPAEAALLEDLLSRVAPAILSPARGLPTAAPNPHSAAARD